MIVLQVHNQYNTPGGEDTVLELEKDLLQKSGCIVHRFTASNKIQSTGKEIRKNLTKKISEINPNIIHLHNTFHRIGSIASEIALELDIPIVQTLHNYRLLCANGLFMMENKPCTKCTTNSRLIQSIHGCYRDSFFYTIANHAMHHKQRKIAKNSKQHYIAITDFAKNILIESGISPERIHVKPNFTTNIDDHNTQRKNEITFIGKLDESKGIDLLVEAWNNLDTGGDWKLNIIGDGPLAKKIKPTASIFIHGWQDKEYIDAHLKSSKYLVMPSRWFETFGMVLIESMANGTPVIASNIGAMKEVLNKSNCGILFEPNSKDSLISALNAAMKNQPNQWEELSTQAKKSQRELFSPDENLGKILSIYNEVIYKWFSHD